MYVWAVIVIDCNNYKYSNVELYKTEEEARERFNTIVDNQLDDLFYWETLRDEDDDDDFYDEDLEEKIYKQYEVIREEKYFSIKDTISILIAKEKIG